MTKHTAQPMIIGHSNIPSLADAPPRPAEPGVYIPAERQPLMLPYLTCEDRCPGRRLPSQGRGPVFRDTPCRGHWYACMTPPSREMASIEILQASPDIVALAPKKLAAWRNRQGNWIKREFPEVSRLIYARFPRDPNWQALRARNIITGVLSSGGVPLILPGAAIRAIQGLQNDIRAAEVAAEELVKQMQRPLEPGETGSIASGPLQGMAVNVKSVKGARLFVESLLGKMQVSAHLVSRENG